jgi:hypothetical protein
VLVLVVVLVIGRFGVVWRKRPMTRTTTGTIWGGQTMPEERTIASWTFKPGSLDQKTASLCYLAANLLTVLEKLDFCVSRNTCFTEAT